MGYLWPRFAIALATLGGLYAFARLSARIRAFRRASYVAAVNALVPTTICETLRQRDAKAGACLLIHGYAASPASFTPLVNRLRSAKFAVLVPWLPAHQSSPHALAHSNPTDWPQAFRALVDELHQHYERVFVVGHSLGGAIALDLARSQPIAAVVAINPMLFLKKIGRFRTERLYRPIALILPWVPYIVKMNMSRPDMKQYAFHYKVIPSAQGARLTEYCNMVLAHASGIDIPALLVSSQRDLVIDPSSSHVFAKVISNSRVALMELQQSGHMALLDWDSEAATSEVFV